VSCAGFRIPSVALTVVTIFTNTTKVVEITAIVARIEGACFVAVAVAVSTTVAARKVVAPRRWAVRRYIAMIVKRNPTLHCSFRAIIP